MSQTRLSKRLGISQPHLSKLLTGRQPIGRRSAIKIAAHTGENLGRVMTMTPAELKAALARIEATDAHQE